MPTNESGPGGPGYWAKAFVLTGLGTTVAGSLLAGLALGWFIDRQLGTMPVFLLVGLVVGIVVGVLGAYKMVRAYLND